MTVISRSDGRTFALRCYRETLAINKVSLFRKEILLLAKSNGNFVRLFPRNDSRQRQVEAVFSRDSGYLLGEAIWRHFGYPAHLIYCEQLADSEQMVLIVVRHGRVFLDSKLTLNECRHELSTLAGIKEPFNVYISGPQVPLSTTLSPGKIYFPPEAILSFQNLEQPLIDNLRIDSDLMLLNVEQAVDELHLDARTKWLATLGVLVVLSGLWFFMFGNQVHTPTVEAQQDPLASYRSELSSPEPAQQLVDIARILIQLYDIPGWQASTLSYNVGGAKVQVQMVGGSTALLFHWAQRQDITVNLAPSGAELLFRTHLPGRSVKTSPENRLNNLSQLLDRIAMVLPGKNLNIGETTNKLTYQATVVTIALDEASPDVLVLLGRALQGLPIRLDAFQANVKEGLVSGTLQMTLLGS